MFNIIFGNLINVALVLGGRIMGIEDTKTIRAIEVILVPTRCIIKHGSSFNDFGPIELVLILFPFDLFEYNLHYIGLRGVACRVFIGKFYQFCWCIPSQSVVYELSLLNAF